MTTTATRSAIDEPTGRPTRLETMAVAVSDAADAVIGATNNAASRLPDMAATTRATFEDASRRIQAGSDEMVAVGTAASFGLAVGLLIGGASRILVAAALVPLAMMGLTMLDRSSASRAAARGLPGPGGS
jgi:hypothetical protein